MFGSLMCRAIVGGVLLLAIAPEKRSSVLAQEAVPTLGPVASIEYLLSLQHGLARLSEQDKALVERIRQRPAEYVEPLASVLDLSTNGAMESLDRRLRLERALGVARLLGAEHGRNVVYPFFLQTSEHLAELRKLNLVTDDPRLATLQHAISLRRQALQVLGEFRDSRAIEAVLATVEADDLATRHVMLQYLTHVGAGSERVKNELTRMTSDPNSPLYRFGPALKALESLR